jgi:cyclase
VIPCLDVEAGRVVKGVRFQGLRDAGDPLELAARYDSEGADELAFLDVRASDQGRGALLDLIDRVARNLFIPFSVGGGIRSIDDVRQVLQAGADKVSLGTAAAHDPALVSRCANHFGRQCIVVSLDVKRAGGRYELTTHGGCQRTGRDALEFAQEVSHLGAGELLLNDMDADGTRAGFGIDLLQAVTRTVPIPVIASGGAGTLADFVSAVQQGGADAVLAASVFHDGTFAIAEVKRALADAGVPVRIIDAEIH